MSARRISNGSIPACAALAAVLAAPLPTAAELTFQNVVIDPSSPSNPHCKTLADIDGDGQLDAVAASSNSAGMFWYEYPTWTKHTIRASGSWTTDMQAGDVDGDGDLDLVIPNGSGLQWYENPRPDLDPRTATWTEHLIGAGGANHHDVELGDMEPDGDLDVVSRKKNGSDTSFWLQDPPNTWTRISLPAGPGEGTALGDLDGDGDLDVAHNGFWMQQQSPTNWVSRTIDTNWDSDVGVTLADIDGNGDLDVVLAPSESAGRLSWYDAIDPVAGPWVEHPIDPSVTYLHTFKAADMDHDGDLDLVTAEMHQSSNPDEVSIYFNDGQGAAWSQQVVAESGSHNLRVGDVGGDGDLDIFGANWNDGAPNSAVIEMWENGTTPLGLGSWQRHILETSLPWNAVFVDTGDLDGDGLPDLALGGWWYANPGVLGGAWVRNDISAPPDSPQLNNVALLHDLDNDGDLDILGTDGKPSGEDLSWARNDGSGTFTGLDITNTATGGDFLQGVSLSQLIAGGQEEVVLSWHNGGSGTAMLSIPADPASAAWPLSVLSATTNQEQVPIGDLDRDGDLDVHLGTDWLRQDASGAFSVQGGVTLSGGGVPDRVVLADLDGDDDLDVVIGVEFASTLVWGENDGSGGGWTEHPIATDFDYFSVDARDVDGDGDIDVVGGAHMGSGQVSLYENDGTGLGWTPHVVDAGHPAVDHHDGTLLVDLDLDRDLDIVSIGWSKQSLVVYENLAIDDGPAVDLTRPTIVAVHALGTATQVEVDFSEPLFFNDTATTEIYTISGGVTVLAAALAVNQRAVTLTTSALSAGVDYILTVDDVEDLAGNPIVPGSTAVFALGAGDPDAGLVAWWPFDEASGTIAVDASGSGRTGFLAGGVTWTADPALSFDGIDDRVEAGSFDVAGEALTLAAWIYPEGLGNCSASDCRILSKSTGTAEGDHFFMLSTISSGGAKLRFRLKTGGVTTTLIATNGELPENQWLHAAAVYDGAKMELFLDGVSVGSASKSGALSQDPGVPVWIGGNPDGATSKPWRGRIDDVRIYDRALSAAELAALPPPSARSIFADGFESGDTSRWASSRQGSLQVTSAAARLGARGLEATAGTSCAAPDQLVLEPPSTTALQGTHLACREIVASGVEVVAPGATLRAGESIRLDDGVFTSGDLALEIDPTLTPFSAVKDDSPTAETSYVADFHLRLDDLILGPADRLEHLVASAAGGGPTFRLVLESDGAGGVEALLEARRDDGTFAVTPAGQQIPIAAGWHHLRLAWQAGPGSGSLTLTLDGAPVAQLTGIANGARRVDMVEWGAVGGTLDATSGSVDLDAFSSWR
jgi:hypothetical protein